MKINFLLLLLTITSISFSQQLPHDPTRNVITPEKCGAMEEHHRLMNTDAQYAAKRQQAEQFYQNFMQTYTPTRVVYTIPVVVHVIHLGESVGTGTNISQTQIESAITNINSVFTSNGVNVQFCLAQRDASGNASTGINRINGATSSVTNYNANGLCKSNHTVPAEINESAVKALSNWDDTKYYNIWIVSEINDNGGGAGVQGFAYFPGAGNGTDGAVMLYNAFGYDPGAGNSSGFNLKDYTDKNTTFVHEMGHALDLYHTFEGDGTGSTCPTNSSCSTQGDLICDTPPHKRSNSDCNSGGTNSCDGNSSNSLFVTNYMDYSSEDCQTSFTAGQNTRIMAALTNASGDRLSLTTSDGCNAVYADEASMYAIVTPTSNECGNSVVPVVTIKNTGSTTLTSLTITYSMNGGTNQVYNWTGSLAQAATENVTLVSMTTSAGSNTFVATLSLPNGATDPNSSNDSQSITFNASGSVPASACAISTTNSGSYNDGISRVRFNTIDNAHNVGNNQGLQDFSCEHYTTLDANTAYNLIVDLEDIHDCKVFIDYNDDGTFDDAGEAIYTGSTLISHTPTINIPQYPATTGKLIRMRIVSDYDGAINSDGCTNSNYGEIEDYGIYINTPACVAPTLNSSPSNTSACSGGTTTMTVSITGPSLTYEWQVNTGSGFTTISNGGVYSGATSTTLTITGFTNAMDGYLYRCYVTNPCGNVTSTSAELIVPAEPTASCSPTTTNTGNFGTGINRYRFNTIDNTHTAGNNDGTQNFVCSDNTSVTAGATYAFTINGGGSNPEYARIYIDYNDNGTFEAGEIVFNEMTTKQLIHTGNITIATSGFVAGKLLRMRVMTDYSTFSSGCPASLTYGEVEDYGVYIPCEIPSAPSVTSDSRCDAGTLNLAATPGAGDAKWYTASTGGASIHTGTSYTTPTLSTTTSYWVESVDKTCVSTTRTEVIASINDCSTKLTTASCGKVLTSMDDPLYSDAVAGATNYRYWVQHAATGYSAVATRGSANNLWNASWLVANPLKYGTTYTVKVSAYVDGAWQPYGSSCNITTPATKLDASSCGKALTTLDEKLYSLPVAGATDYRYEVRKKSDNSLVAISTRGFADNLWKLSWLVANPAQLNAAYAIRVSAKVGGTWQAYGPVCYVITPTTTKLASGSCGITISSLDQALYSETIASATDYRYEIRKQSDNSLLAVSTRGFANNLWKLSWLVSNPAQLNTTYVISVAIKVDGLWSAYGTACTVTTPSAMIINENDSFVALNLETYPNPNDGNFTISSSQEGTFNIINELGQLIQKVEITKENNYQTKVENFRQGIYFITGTVNNEVVTKKVVVQ